MLLVINEGIGDHSRENNHDLFSYNPTFGRIFALWDGKELFPIAFWPMELHNWITMLLMKTFFFNKDCPFVNEKVVLHQTWMMNENYTKVRLSSLSSD